jgi:hypothetical protein
LPQTPLPAANVLYPGTEFTPCIKDGGTFFHLAREDRRVEHYHGKNSFLSNQSLNAKQRNAIFS